MISLLMTCCHLYKSRKVFITFARSFIYYPLLTSLFNLCIETAPKKPHSNPYKLTIIISDIARLFKPVRIGRDKKSKGPFLKLSFSNKSLNTVNLGNILHHKLVQSKIPPYFKDQSVLIISYTYTKPIKIKIVNYKHVCRISILTISGRNLLIAPLLVPIHI